jgi:hypothetical protein
MKIISGYPPNFDKISEALPGAHREGIVFACHPNVYKPHGNPELPPELSAHEAVHLKRQAEAGGPEQWWDDYISSAPFRFEEEALAHLAEAWSLVKQAGNCNRNKRREIAARIGGRLSSPLYNAGASKKAAIKLIAAGIK